jgi:hypothetical protein
MNLSRISITLVAGILLGVGCKKDETRESPPAAANVSTNLVLPKAQIIASIHWLGKKEISTRTNSAKFIAIWDLPESARLESQTLDKLSRFPWTCVGKQADTNSTSLLRPLLSDMLERECYLEVSGRTNAPRELVLAVRLETARAELWRTNLNQAFQSLAEPQSGSGSQDRQSWSVKTGNRTSLIELSRAGEWTLIGLAQDHSSLLDDLRARIERKEGPFSAPGTTNWLEIDADLGQLAGDWVSETNIPGGLPRIDLTFVYDGPHLLRTRGELNFPRELPMRIDPWTFPTNLMDGWLASITTIRGIEPWLGKCEFWKNLHVGPPPNQMAFWGLAGLEMQTYFEAPMKNASNAVSTVTDLVLERSSEWFGTNEFAGLGRSQKFNGFEWQGIPYMWPFLQSTNTENGEFVFGGMFVNMPQYPLSSELLEVLNRTNLVYYDWEMTGPRVEHWLYMGQLIRSSFNRPQLPFDSAGLLWLKALSMRLGENATHFTETGPRQLTVLRRSSIGLTGIELHLLVDWLESPDFPAGLYTFSAGAH